MIKISYYIEVPVSIQLLIIINFLGATVYQGDLRFQAFALTIFSIAQVLQWFFKYYKDNGIKIRIMIIYMLMAFFIYLLFFRYNLKFNIGILRGIMSALFDIKVIFR